MKPKTREIVKFARDILFFLIMSGMIYCAIAIVNEFFK